MTQNRVNNCITYANVQQNWQEVRPSRLCYSCWVMETASVENTPQFHTLPKRYKTIGANPSIGMTAGN